MNARRGLGSILAGLGLLAAACAPVSTGSPDGGPPPDPDAPRADATPIDAVPPPALVLAHSASELYAYAVGAQELRPIGPIVWPLEADQLTDLAVDRAGRVIGTSFSRVYSLDPATAEATFLADLAVNTNGLAFVPSSAGDALYGVTQLGDVYKINPDTGVATKIGSYGSGLGSSGDLAWVPGRGLMGIVSDLSGIGTASQLASIDVATGVATVVGPTGVLDLYGIAHADGVIYGFSPDGTRVRIDPVTGAGQLVAADTIAWWGAGSRP